MVWDWRPWTTAPAEIRGPSSLPGESNETASVHEDNPDHRIYKVAISCVLLFDELDRNLESFDQERRSLAEHVMARLGEILSAAGVQTIDGEATFDRRRHQPDKATTTDARIAETLSPGFALGQRVLRRARVRII
jgi:molecular chaperone GrpE (heat shock protein)